MDNMNQQAPAQEPMQQSAPAQTMQTGMPKKSKKGFVAAIVIVLVLLLGAGGAFAYFTYLRVTPEQVFENMLVSLTKLRSAEFAGDLDIQFSQDDGGDSSGFGLGTIVFNSAYEGAFALADDNTLKTSRFDINFGVDQGAIPFDLSNLSLRTRLIDKMWYLQVDYLPNLGFFDLTPFNNRWIKISDVEEEVGNFVPVDPSLISSAQLSKEQIEQLRVAFSNAHMFTLVELKEGETSINGVATYHYSVTPVKENVLAFIASAMPIVNEATTQQDILDAQQQVSDMLDSLQDSTIEVWVGKKDFNLYKLLVQGESQPTEDDPYAITVDFNIAFGAVNEPVTLEVPEGATTFESLMQEIQEQVMATSPFGPLGGDTMMYDDTMSSEVSAFDTDSDNDGLTDYEEDNYYFTDPTNPDTDGDGYSDGEEVINGYNPTGEGAL